MFADNYLTTDTDPPLHLRESSQPVSLLGHVVSGDGGATLPLVAGISSTDLALADSISVIRKGPKRA